MTTKKMDAARYCADLEGDATVLAISPRLLAKERRAQEISAVRLAIRDALIALGYQTERATTVAERLASQLPVVEPEP